MSLRVLLVTQPTTGGTGRCVDALAAAAAAGGMDVRVACPSDGPLPERVVASGATWIPVELTRQPSPADLRHVAAMRALARDVDVVHLHSSKAGAVGRLAVRRLDRRPATVFTPHGWSWQSGGPLVPVYREFERRAARWLDVIVAVSDEERAAGLAVLGPSARIEVINNGVDTRRFVPEGDTAPRETAPLVVCVGRLAYPKAQDVAVRALAAMATADARLRLVGDGPDRAAIASLAAKLGVADRVELVGEVDDPRPHLRAADVVVVPSHSEGQSVAMLEAMACGRPVVSTAVSGAGALGAAGVVVPVGDAPAIARALDALLADDDARDRMGAAARERAVSCFDLRHSVARTLLLWRRLAARSITAVPS